MKTKITIKNNLVSAIFIKIYEDKNGFKTIMESYPRTKYGEKLSYLLTDNANDFLNDFLNKTNNNVKKIKKAKKNAK